MHIDQRTQTRLKRVRKVPYLPIAFPVLTLLQHPHDRVEMVEASQEVKNECARLAKACSQPVHVRVCKYTYILYIYMYNLNVCICVSTFTCRCTYVRTYKHTYIHMHIQI